jgi:transcriptional regulator with XRE-family HTH domain
MYPNLKIAIFKRGLRQNHLAKELGMNDALLSKIIHGFREPTDEQRTLLARYLGEDEDWLFEKFETAVAARSVGGVYSTSGRENGDS